MTRRSTFLMVLLAGALGCDPDPEPPPTGQCPVVTVPDPQFVGLGDDQGAGVCIPSGAADIMKGHLLSASQGYELFGNTKFKGELDGNCHNASLNGSREGAVICKGNPTLANANYKDMSQYHTFSWSRFTEETKAEWFETIQDEGTRLAVMEATGNCDAGTLFFNWNRLYAVCRLPPAGAAPDMKDKTTDTAGRSFYSAGAWGCSSQHSDAETRAVVGDGDIENANPEICKAWVARHHAGDAACNQDLCIQCCHGRRDFWLPHLPLCGATAADANDFDAKCVAACKT